MQRWGGYPSHITSTAWLTLREANLVGRYLRRSIEAGHVEGQLADYHERYVELLSCACQAATAEGEEDLAGAAVRLLENAAEYAGPCGRSATIDEIGDLIATYTHDLAEQDSVIGHVLCAELPSTLERVAGYR